MKKLSYIITSLLLSSYLYADVDINWQASGGFYFYIDSGVGILGDGTGYSTIAQLIYSLDGNVDDALINGGVSGDDIVWDSLVITEDGVANDGSTFDSYALFSLQNYTQSFVSGYVYARIFQDDSIDANDWYYYTTPIALQDITGATPSQLIEMNTDTINGNAIDFGSNVAQVVPEPATFLLFGMGVVGAWLVRRNKLKTREEEA